jgi:hypothetical protein
MSSLDLKGFNLGCCYIQVSLTFLLFLINLLMPPLYLSTRLNFPICCDSVNGYHLSPLGEIFISRPIKSLSYESLNLRSCFNLKT